MLSAILQRFAESKQFDLNLCQPPRLSE